MDKIFKLNRIKFDEMIQDTVKYLTEKYEETGEKFTPASPYGQLLGVIENLGQLMFLYNEDSITELNIDSASRPQSIYGWARLAGYNPMRAISATGSVSLSYNGSELVNGGNIIRIPNNTKLKCTQNGLSYTITLPQDEFIIPAKQPTTFVVNVVQGSMETQSFTGDGTPLQSMEVNMLQGIMADHFRVEVFVNSEKMQIYEATYDIPKGAKACMVKTGINSGIDIYFGCDFFGYVPPPGSEIIVRYLVSKGEGGNIRQNTGVGFEFIDQGYDEFNEPLDLNELISIKINSPIMFGSNPEPTFLVKQRAPKTSRSMVLANPENYILFLEKYNFFSVVDAFTTFEDDFLDDDNIIYLFLIPDIKKRLLSNENYFTVPAEQFALLPDEKDKVLQLIHESGSMIVTTVVKILDPIIKKYIVNVSLVIYEGYSKESIRNEILYKLSEYFLTMRRRDRIPKSDLTAIVENVDGVDSVNVHFMSEDNEMLWAGMPTGTTPSEIVGLDEFGDIVIGRGELPIIRGGWPDRSGLWYDETVDFGGSNKPCSVNIEFKKIVPKNFNAKMNRLQVNKIRST